MSFASLRYLLFLPAVVLAHWLCPSRWRWVLLLAASLLFYASWDLPLTLLLLAVIAASYLAALAMDKVRAPGLRKLLLFLALGVCVALLLYFKYFNFLAGTLARLLRPLAGGDGWRQRDILLPVGCSFYTFQAMSYVIDVYRRSRPAERHPGYYALFISFFPQLVAGPIERAERLLPQLRAERRFSPADLRAGLRLLLSGYFRKLAIADLCGAAVTTVYAAARPDGAAVLLATVLFAFQIYCDFAGYSEIAAGSARLLGIDLMRNFDRPYLADSLREFWRRWHISLSRWFTDYLYIPLGGSRRGRGRQILATLAVFTVSGLWHGADWTFVLWGLFHGCLLVCELLHPKAAKKNASPAGRVGRTALTFALVTFGWIFFRAESPDHAALLIGRLFSPWDLPAALAAMGLSGPEWLCLALSLAQLPLLHRLSEKGREADMSYVYLLLSAALAWLLCLSRNSASAFIYFQF